LHQRVVDFLDANAADYSLDFIGMWVYLWGLGKEGLKINLFLDLRLQAWPVIARQPVNNRVDFFFCATFLLYFLDIQRIHAGKFNLVCSFVIHGVFSLLILGLFILNQLFRLELSKNSAKRAIGTFVMGRNYAQTPLMLSQREEPVNNRVTRKSTAVWMSA